MSNIDEQLYGGDFFGLGVNGKPPAAPLAEKFLIPPFSVLNAREGIWQDRKRAWLSLGIQSEVGRGGETVKSQCDATPGGTGKNSAFMFNGADGHKSLKQRAEEAEGGGTAAGLTFGAFSDEFSLPASGTSIFDPVLCELAYKWFSGEMGQIIDPFAGGSVRGVVASLLGRAYWGCELRPEQVEANIAQGKLLCADNPPVWHCGDSLTEMAKAPLADAILTCPPYGDLEVYSDMPADLSAMEWPKFLEAYRAIIAASCARLRPDRFATIVVGDFRCPKTGMYRNFISETIRAFMDAGMALYNEAILVTSVGSLPVRITKQFESGRKLGKSHQQVLVFCKGDWRKAAKYCNEEA